MPRVYWRPAPAGYSACRKCSCTATGRSGQTPIGQQSCQPTHEMPDVTMAPSRAARCPRRSQSTVFRSAAVHRRRLSPALLGRSGLAPGLRGICEPSTGGGVSWVRVARPWRLRRQRREGGTGLADAPLRVVRDGAGFSIVPAAHELLLPVSGRGQSGRRRQAFAAQRCRATHWLANAGLFGETRAADVRTDLAHLTPEAAVAALAAAARSFRGPAR